MGSPPALLQLTLAAERVAAMVDFYEQVFSVELRAVDAYGTTLYQGRLDGTPFTICPNTIADVQAAANRHQFHYEVADLDAVAAAVQRGGGTVRDRQPDAMTVLDPDGNTIVFQRA